MIYRNLLGFTLITVLWLGETFFISAGVAANPFQAIVPGGDTDREVSENATVESSEPVYTGFLINGGEYTAFISIGRKLISVKKGDEHPFGKILEIYPEFLSLRKDGHTEKLMLSP